MLIEAFQRDEVFHDLCPQSAYLDLETGEVIWVGFKEGRANSDPAFFTALRGKVVAKCTHCKLTHLKPWQHSYCKGCRCYYHTGV